MHCFTLRNGTTTGIRLHKFGAKYAIWIQGSGDMAHVSLEDFDEMVRRGHATNHSMFEWSYWTNIARTRGPIVYRCDFKRDEKGRLWLIPEQEESKNGLVWAPRFCDHRCVRVLAYSPSEIFVRKIDFYQREHLLIDLTPENPIWWCKRTTKILPGTGPSWKQPFRLPKFYSELTPCRYLELSVAGKLIEKRDF